MTSINPLKIVKPRSSEFQRLRIKLGLVHSELVLLLGVDSDTLEAWDWEKDQAPDLAFRLIRLYSRRNLEGWGQEWKGFYYSRGRLNFGKDSFSPRSLKNFKLYEAVYSHVQLANMRYRDGLSLDDSLNIVFQSQEIKRLELIQSEVVPDSGF